MHFALATGALLFAIPLFRTIVKRFVYQPGDGPTKEAAAKDVADYRGIATPDVQTPNPARAYCRAHYNGSLYGCKLHIPASKFLLIS
jgi:short subunit dehydrogenase-like uncharacterized protein